MFKFLLHDVNRLSTKVFQCKRCKKYFAMNLTFRAEITKEEAERFISNDNKFLEPWLKKQTDPNILAISNLDFHNTWGYLEDLSLKERICWR